MPSIVLPHPGGPYTRAPLGALTPIFVNLSGSITAVTRLSASDSLTSSSPPMSPHRIVGLST